MWDRLKAAPQKQGGGLFEDPRDAASNRFGYNSNNGYSYSIKGGPPPPRPPREYYDSRFETSPAVQEPPPRNPNRNLYRDSTLRPASSVYSEPSPTYPQFPANVASRRPPQYGYGGVPAGDGISPPSSPEPEYIPRQQSAPLKRPSSADVSPIDEEGPDMSQFGGSRQGGTAAAMGQQIGDPPQGRTNIPQMRRARRKQSDAALREAHSRERMNQPQDPKAQVLWDPMTGERTNTELGRPSQVNPAEYAHGLGISDATRAPAQQKKSPTVTTMFGERVRRLAQVAKPDRSENAAEDRSTDPAAGAFSSNRPGWRGASGRTALVDPVRDTRDVAPLKPPQRSEKRIVSPTSATAKSGLSLGLFKKGQTPPVSPRGPETPTGTGPRDTIRKVVPSSQISPSATKGPEAAGQSYPSPPLSGSSPGPDAPSIAAKQLQSHMGRALRDDMVAGSPTSPDFRQNSSNHVDKTPIRRKPPPPSAEQNVRESVSSVYSQQSSAPPPPPPHNPNAGYLNPSDPWEQPPSRFSVTTYGETPRESFDDFNHDRPPVPETPDQFRANPQTMHDSIMDRGRPVGLDQGYDSPLGTPVVVSLKEPYMSSPYGNKTSHAAIERKAAATGANVIRARTTVERPVSSASSINKSLPAPPPETSANAARDRVGYLNAQLQSLGNRRINLTRSIKQMTELMPTDNLMASNEVIRKREIEKRKVETLREELSDVQREEYELGLKLHRAYKRMDRDADWEPTTLWVRRVTG
ncbi:hypothetical protein GQ53DRAFT_744893 [Thozetella sp. PMI_491]|nr:hypothetical protein GQ53DRAFT_744893 [Thozetella sp. PMI_491]